MPLVLAGDLLTVLVGPPILHLRSDYLGIATLGFGIVARVLFENSGRVISGPAVPRV